jgi:hypothetical protein
MDANIQYLSRPISDAAKAFRASFGPGTDAVITSYVNAVWLVPAKPTADLGRWPNVLGNSGRTLRRSDGSFYGRLLTKGGWAGISIKRTRTSI